MLLYFVYCSLVHLRRKKKGRELLFLTFQRRLNWIFHHSCASHKKQNIVLLAPNAGSLIDVRSRSPGLPVGSVDKRICLQFRRAWFDPWVGKSLEENGNHFSMLAWLIHGQRALAGYTVHGIAKSDTDLETNPPSPRIPSGPQIPNKQRLWRITHPHMPILFWLNLPHLLKQESGYVLYAWFSFSNSTQNSPLMFQSKYHQGDVLYQW